jgi:hypothetical protein
MWCVHARPNGEVKFVSHSSGLLASAESWKKIDPDAFDQFDEPRRSELEQLQRQFMTATGLSMSSNVQASMTSTYRAWSEDGNS